MKIKTLYVKQFRNCQEGFYEFGPGINSFIGPNAAGKTSLLEALYTLMVGRSFRTMRTRELIQKECHFFHIEVLFQKHTIDQKLSFYTDTKEKKIVHNSTLLPNVSSLLGLIPGLIITPDDVQLIKGSPHLRRHFLDLQIAQVDPLYVHYLARYSRAMQQRNQLLKHKQSATIEIWELEMARAGAYITVKRKEQLAALLNNAQTLYSFLTQEKEHLDCRYTSSTSEHSSATEIQDYLLNRYRHHRTREMMLGYSLNGPHKDDIWIGIGGLEARSFASEGQQRSVVIALQLAAWEQMKAKAEVLPLLLIDDIGMGLDNNRNQKLIQSLENRGQIFLTSTDSALLSTHSSYRELRVALHK